MAAAIAGAVVAPSTAALDAVSNSGSVRFSQRPTTSKHRRHPGTLRQQRASHLLLRLEVVSGGTDTHLVLVDLRPKKLTGKAAERSLENAGITCNKNGVPFDPESPFVTSGIRLGSPAGTSRGFGVEEFRLVGNLIGDVLDGLSSNPEDNSHVENDVKLKVKALCEKFPIYSSAI